MPLRILHLTDRLSGRGGADWHLLGILDALAPAHEVHLAVGRREIPPPDGVAIHLLPGLDARGARPVPGLDDLLRRLVPDVVHVHNVVNPGLLERLGELPALVTVQDHRAFCPGRGKLTGAGRVCRHPLESGRCRACFDDARYADGILELTVRRLAALGAIPLIVLSRYMAGELVGAGLTPEQVHVIPPFVHGLDPEAPPAGGPCVLFVGRLVEAKGVWDAVEVHRQAGLDLPLVFAGTGSARSALEAAGCRVTGWLDRRTLSGWYRSAAAVVLPSRWQEPFGIVGLEALSMGTPVAAWDSGGIAEWHPGVPELVPWGDVGGLAGALTAAVGASAGPGQEFRRELLMARLEAVYGRVAG